ncbi:MAG: radical SAM family heme chaperone HemW [Bacteroidota bacterium]|nr:radical SAM family heme chaperone HemW [Bacteroidota bacterium]
MQGLYLHIPFCRQRCHYCDFYFVTNNKLQEEFTQSIILELENRKGELDNSKPISSIYFGGGTPSLLDTKYLAKIFEKIYNIYQIDEHAEITLEANPDDLDLQKLKELKSLPINRLSVGIQSFFEEDLKWMNRAHNKEQAIASLDNIALAGFDNISADLIYGFDILSNEKWVQNLDSVSKYSHIKHLSCYQLTVEPKTPLEKLIKKGIYNNSPDEKFVEQFEILMDWTATNNFCQYEISNFSKAGYEAVHNSNYWKGFPYLGLGPSAHSYDGVNVRKKNTAHLGDYIINPLQYETENLSKQNLYNEYIMTRLRTSSGIKMQEVKSIFGNDYYNYLYNMLGEEAILGYINVENDIIILNKPGKLMADGVAAAMFI